MLRGQMELPSEMLGLAVSEGIVVLTEEEYEALEAREQVTMPEAFAPVVCFDGEVWGVSLAGPNPEARHFITCACEGDARGLHEALEARKPQASAEVIERARRWAQQLRLWPRRATPTEDGLRLIPEDCLRRCSAAFDALLAAVEAAPEPAPEPAPDFAAMSPDELRAWLDERGRREGYENRSGRWHVLARERTSGNMIAYVADQPTERAALLALCQKVAAKEASC